MTLEELREALTHRRGWGWSVPGLEAMGADNGRVVLRTEVTLDLVNTGKTLHGGAAATLVDIAGSIAIIDADPYSRYGVSTDLNVTWFAPVPLGDAAVVDARVLKTGKSLAFVVVEIHRESDNALCAQGRMTKSLGPLPS